MELRALDLLNFTDGTFFRTFFYSIADIVVVFRHVTQTPAFLKVMHTKTDTFLIS